MLKRGYIILITGSVLLIAGIIVARVWVVSFADQVLRENIIFSTTVKPSTYNDTWHDHATLQINDTGRNISVIIPPPIYPAQHNRHLENITFVVKDPNGREVRLNRPDDLAGIRFKPKNILYIFLI